MIHCNTALRKILLCSVLSILTAFASANDNPFVGSWALSLPGGVPGWLGVTQEPNYLDASMLWGWGSVTPVDSVVGSETVLVFTRSRDVQRKNAQGKVLRTQRFTETYTARVDGDTLNVTLSRPHENDTGVDLDTFKGHRTPPLPIAPDLKKTRFGKGIDLLHRNDFGGWTPTDPKALNGWTISDGVLKNEVFQEEGKPHKNWTNLRTEQVFTDFNLTLEARVPAGGNSGIYIRGLYEIQIFDSYGKPLDPHHMGALYSRITPSIAAEKPAGEWQTLDITFVSRHLTVILNGTTIIDNKPVLGITGGALSADEFTAGPIFLQGDHSSVEYRNIVLRPVEE